MHTYITYTCTGIHRYMQSMHAAYMQVYIRIQRHTYTKQRYRFFSRYTHTHISMHAQDTHMHTKQIAGEGTGWDAQALVQIENSTLILSTCLVRQVEPTLGAVNTMVHHLFYVSMPCCCWTAIIGYMKIAIYSTTSVPISTCRNTTSIWPYLIVELPSTDCPTMCGLWSTTFLYGVCFTWVMCVCIYLYNVACVVCEYMWYCGAWQQLSHHLSPHVHLCVRLFMHWSLATSSRWMTVSTWSRVYCEHVIPCVPRARDHVCTASTWSRVYCEHVITCVLRARDHLCTAHELPHLVHIEAHVETTRTERITTYVTHMFCCRCWQGQMLRSATASWTEACFMPCIYSESGAGQSSSMSWPWLCIWKA
jgi:hypothetical protein